MKEQGPLLKLGSENGRSCGGLILLLV